MISIIICSKQPKLSSQLEQNINNTIGVPFEIILIDNSENQYSIFEAYNQGVTLAKYATLCFVHEDVKFHSKNWGQITITHLKSEAIGLIGLAGSQYLLDMPSSWFKAKPVYRNLIQSGYADGSSKKITFEKQNIEAVAVDGFCFFTKKILFENIKFDEKTFFGFHFYDVDICMQILEQGFKIRLVNDILVEHFSIGTLNEDWVEDAITFYKKWEYKLPIKANAKIKIPFIRKIKGFKTLLKMTKKINLSLKT